MATTSLVLGMIEEVLHRGAFDLRLLLLPRLVEHVVVVLLMVAGLT